MYRLIGRDSSEGTGALMWIILIKAPVPIRIRAPVPFGILFLVIIPLIFFTGCATVKYPPVDRGRVRERGTYHEVTRGQTLWSIARIYDVDLKQIVSANRLPRASKIEVGQLIFIPEVRDTAKAGYVKDTKLENFIWPVKGVVVSYFGSIKNIVKNKGIDIQTQEGKEVVASRSGKVAFVSNHLKGYGKTIIIDHLDGFQTVYAHNRENLVKADQRITQGQVIAKIGKTGRVDKPTLHFEIRKNHKPQNPFYYLP